jgi:hypothetical protein
MCAWFPDWWKAVIGKVSLGKRGIGEGAAHRYTVVWRNRSVRRSLVAQAPAVNAEYVRRAAVLQQACKLDSDEAGLQLVGVVG